MYRYCCQTLFPFDSSFLTRSLVTGQPKLFYRNIILFSHALLSILTLSSQYERLVEQSLDLEGIDNHEYRINPNYRQERSGERAREE